jgi:hypothetical protein
VNGEQDCHRPPDASATTRIDLGEAKAWRESIMNNGRDDCQRISRRVALSGAALALGAAAIPTAVPQAAAQQKISQADAKYQGTPKGDQHCDGCVNFQPPNACKFVQGDISPSGWCQLFTPKS